MVTILAAKTNMIRLLIIIILIFVSCKSKPDYQKVDDKEYQNFVNALKEGDYEKAAIYAKYVRDTHYDTSKRRIAKEWLSNH